MLDKIIVFLLSDWDKFLTQVESINLDNIILFMLIVIVVKFLTNMISNSYHVSGSKSHMKGFLK